MPLNEKWAKSKCSFALRCFSRLIIRHRLSLQANAFLLFKTPDTYTYPFLLPTLSTVRSFPFKKLIRNTVLPARVKNYYLISYAIQCLSFIFRIIFLLSNRHIWHRELEEIAEDIIARGGIPFTQGGYLLLSHSSFLEGSQQQGLMACQLKLHKSKTTICSVENYQLVASLMPLPQQTLFCANI